MSYKHLRRGGCQLLHNEALLKDIQELDGKVLGCFVSQRLAMVIF